MTDQLDSRALHYTDCYGQRFMKAGTYRYGLGPAGSGEWTREFPHVIEVVDAPAGSRRQMAQTTVTVRLEGGSFVPEKDHLTVATGDMVTWHSPDAHARPFTVTGEKAFFASDRLVNESGYTHVFATTGTYDWVDAHGSQVRGRVTVVDPQCRTAEDIRAWQKQLAEGRLVMIADGRAEPADLEVLLGQTVFFAVVNGPGISVTDSRLIEQRRPAPGERPRASA